MGTLAHQLRIGIGALMIDTENRDLGLLGVARIGTSFATWSFTIALGVYGFEAHGVVGVGIVALIRLLPGAIASPFMGLLADRNPRRDVLVRASLAMAVVLAGAAFAAGQDASADVVFVFPALFAIALAAYVPAESALFPVLARTPQELSASNVNHAAMENAGFIVAAIASGLLLTATSPGTVFAVAAAVAAVVTVLLALVRRDRRPVYEDDEESIGGVLREATQGARALRQHPGLRLASLTLVVLLLFEGFADVILVTLALELLHLEEGSVGFLNAAWGVGAIVGGIGLALLLDRGHLVIAIAGGSLAIGAATMLPGFWPEELTSYLAWFGIGIGFTFVEVAAKTLMGRLGDDETMGRLVSSLESGRLAAQAAGSLGAIVLVEALHPDGALIALGALMPVFVFLCWTRLRAYEVGAPVAEAQYQLLRGNSIFAPLPIATVERLSHDLNAVEVPAGEEIITQGDIGDRFYLIEAGQVEVFEHGEFRRNEGPGESFGEIALLHDVPRTATVRATVPTRLQVLEREQFLLAVVGHRRSQQLARSVSEERWLVRD
ncbi:MAG TPA: MFS transporter [Solirubrobacterales bacterium]|jgi:MFS family permease|nr:MFS transporter [Solirubrobacterales bacterium]